MTENKKPNNDDDDAQSSSVIERIQPPASRKAKIKQPFKLLIEIAYLAMIFVPLLIWSIVEEILFSKRKSVRGKTVLITGSGRGLGQGLAKKFAELGCNVACVDVDEKLNVETVEMLNEKRAGCAKGYTCNVLLSDEIKAVREAVKRDFGRVDILIHNAGLLVCNKVDDFEDVYAHSIVGVNLTSHFLMIREFLPDMMERNDGHIVATASIVSFFGVGNASMYTATKYGVLGFMESLHFELNANPKNRIKTTTICPYAINTSALYSDLWTLRLPELSVDETVEAAVDGILKNKRVFTIPFHLYYFATFLKLLPDKLIDRILSIFYVKIPSIPPMSLQKQLPIYRHLLKSASKMEAVFRDAA